MIAAQHMEHVIAADRQPIAVAGDHPHVELGRASFRPVATAGARPWMVWKP